MGLNNSFYFDHDYNARGDQKILELRAEFGWEGYGLYFAILESLCESNGYIRREALAGLSFGLSHPKDRLVIVIEFCIKIGILQESKDGIFSNRILIHLAKRAMLSEYGRKGGMTNKKQLSVSESVKVANGSQSEATLEATLKPPLSPPPSRRGEERRGEKRKEEKEIKGNFNFSFLDSEKDSKLIDQFMRWFEYKQGSDSPYKQQAPIEAAYANLVRYSEKYSYKAELIVNGCIEAGSKSLYLADNIKNIVSPLAPMPR